MKKLLPLAAFVILSPLALPLLRSEVAAQAPKVQQPAPQAEAEAEAQSLEVRVGALEKELAAQKQSNEQMRTLLEQTLAYLDKQAKAATAQLAVLDEAEKQGFAVGENWKSRETLLAGMRAQLQGQLGVPKLPPPPPAPKPAPPMRKRP
ncbi:MAG: hypothetical protein EXS08_00950 [Planctomycetes bacterium]|nr:hypothetical protein [Planctomycetota bacterium]